MNPEIELDRANASPLFESAIVPVFSLTLFVSAALPIPMNPEIELDRANASPLFESAIVPVFSLTLFVSAALLFWVQPLVTKMLLPLLGGGPSVWNTAMVFFQALLLGGYAYGL